MNPTTFLYIPEIHSKRYLKSSYLERERLYKEDKPWLCMMPTLIGMIATLIGIGEYQCLGLLVKSSISAT